jgi:GDPmannose 4,6-dehydratase
MEGVSPYGISKLKAHELCKYYRLKNNLFISTAISFNHESVRRPPNFVTRKVTKYVARYHLLKDIPPLEIVS